MTSTLIDGLNQALAKKNGFKRNDKKKQDSGCV